MMTEEKRAYRDACRREARERFEQEYGGTEASSPVSPGEPSSGDIYGYGIEDALQARVGARSGAPRRVQGI